MSMRSFCMKLYTVYESMRRYKKYKDPHTSHPAHDHVVSADSIEFEPSLLHVRVKGL